MEYSIQTLSKMAGVSTRTLRYYDEIGLLKPIRISSSNYRIYGELEVNLLQQILFYRELDLPLSTIKSIITKEDFDFKTALKEHKEKLLMKQKQIETLLHNVDQTIQSLEGGIVMSNQEKFEGLKKEKIAKNEQKYGKEIRKKYGDEAVNAANEKFGSLNEAEYKESEKLAEQIINILKELTPEGDPSCEKATELVKLHKQWLSYYGNYSNDAHIGLGQMYVADERFTKYYDDKAGTGAAQFLCNAIQAYYQ